MHPISNDSLGSSTWILIGNEETKKWLGDPGEVRRKLGGQGRLVLGKILHNGWVRLKHDGHQYALKIAENPLLLGQSAWLPGIDYIRLLLLSLLLQLLSITLVCVTQIHSSMPGHPKAPFLTESPRSKNSYRACHQWPVVVNIHRQVFV